MRLHGEAPHLRSRQLCEAELGAAERLCGERRAAHDAVATELPAVEGEDVGAAAAELPHDDVAVRLRGGEGREDEGAAEERPEDGGAEIRDRRQWRGADEVERVVHAPRRPVPATVR